jgi:hypothetical protein
MIIGGFGVQCAMRDHLEPAGNGRFFLSGDRLLAVKRLETNNGLRKLPKATGLLLLSLACLTAARASAAEKPGSAVRWTEGSPGCTFSRDDDGKYRYGLWTDDLGITFAIDSQELQRSTRRMDPFLAILLSFHYRGTGSIDVRAHGIKLEFVSHSHVQHRAVDPESFSTEYKNLVDSAAEQDQREIKKHPQKKEQQEAVMRAAAVELAEVQEFLMAHSLHPVKLDPGNPEASGWVFFKARDKWIGKWKVQEEFLLEIPAGTRIFEFPFKLPPRAGDLILRKRD